jgi:DNA-binding response OmpR family regulator
VTEPEASILLVEDDEALRRVVARHLRGQGFAVDEAISAEQAVGALKAGLRPRLVLLDLNLPGDTGWDLLRRRELTDAGSPPVVITSATTVSPRRLAEFHVAGYLPKPFPLETLVATVERLFGSTRLREHALADELLERLPEVEVHVIGAKSSSVP